MSGIENVSLPIIANKTSMGKLETGIFRGLESTDYTDHYKEVFLKVEALMRNQKNRYGEGTFKELKTMIENSNPNKVIGISDPAEFRDHPDYKYDQVVAAFIQGCGGSLDQWQKIKDLPNPIALRSIVKTPIMKACLERNRDFYYIDTGYFGNYGKAKLYHRITRNAMQYLGPIVDRPDDRFRITNTELIPFNTNKKKYKGSRILVCPPSEKAMSNGWGIDHDLWLQQTVETIKQHTDREIVIREKKIRHERQLHDTIWAALQDDIYCMVTFNSIAAIEALCAGKPVFAMGPNAAHHFAKSDLSQIENPLIPDDEEIYKFFCHLAYCQFTKAEMKDGTAWSILNP